MLKWTLIVLAVAFVLTYAVLSYFMGGPTDVYGFLRFALPQWHKGQLQVGDPAPDAELLTLDGHSTFRLRERLAGRPLVLIFGSYT